MTLAQHAYINAWRRIRLSLFDEAAFRQAAKACREMSAREQSDANRLLDAMCER